MWLHMLSCDALASISMNIREFQHREVSCRFVDRGVSE